MVEILKQGQYTPFDTIDQCISMFAGSKGILDDVALDKVNAFERDMLAYFAGPQRALRAELAAGKSFKGLDEKFLSALKTFKSAWKPA